jgi:hypothetical protein
MTVNHMAIKEISKLLETEIGGLLSNPSNHYYFPGDFSRSGILTTSGEFSRLTKTPIQVTK